METRKLTPLLVTSLDGSHTLHLPELKEHYHSQKGALAESKYVFIEKGLLHASEKKTLRILEVGFGTGLNMLLTAVSSQGQKIHYTALEPHPLSEALISKLNYAKMLDTKEAALIFAKIHATPWNSETQVADHCVLCKCTDPLERFQPEVGFDLVYYDAFAPHAQPELWEAHIWKKLAGWMNKGATLVTYCAKGQVRRDMQAAGLLVERLQGPPGKREMLRCTKP